MDTRELEKELLAGLEGVTPGPWHALEAFDYPHKPPPGYWFISDGRGNLADDVEPVDAAHIARCSPDNIRALLATIADLRATAAEAGWRTMDSAPKNGTRFWGAVDDDAIAMLWHEGFGAFVSSWRRMEMAPGYTIDGEPFKDHSPVIHHPNRWMPIPQPPVTAKHGGSNAE